MFVLIDTSQEQQASHNSNKTIFDNSSLITVLVCVHWWIVTGILKDSYAFSTAVQELKMKELQSFEVPVTTSQ